VLLEEAVPEKQFICKERVGEEDKRKVKKYYYSPLNGKRK